jgi:hypothetical protein
MSVFLRWGILGILSVAGLLYAYNASKRLAEARSQQAAPVGNTSAVQGGEPEEVDSAADAATDGLTPECAQELLVAERAREMRRQGETLDRLLRIQEIAWQEPAERRERLEAVATRWFGRDAPVGAEELRSAVLRDCEPSGPAP